MIRRKLILTKASGLLNQANIVRPPVDIKSVAESQGAIVIEEPNEAETSGFLFRSVGTPPIIGVNANHHRVRKRFTIAHELGHLLLHATEGVHLDQSIVKMRNARTSEGTDDDEIEANRFAAEILMPRSFIENDLAESGPIYADDEKEIIRLASKYEVSPQAMAIRLSSLGLVWM